MNIPKITLGELLSSFNETIKRNAMSVLKTIQKIENDKIMRSENDTLICSHIGCDNPQNADTEFCDYHSR